MGGGATAIVGHLASSGALRPALDQDRARDIVWTLISADIYHLLVVDRGWSLTAYETWLAETLITTLTPCKPRD